MNSSMYSADRTTHLKIVVLALVAAIGVAGFGISARFSASDGYSQAAHLIKAGKPSYRADGLPLRCLPGRVSCST